MEKNMWIKKIKINNFRNYQLEEINLNKNINIFYGEMHKEKQILLNPFFYVVWENLLEQKKIKK